MAIPNSYVTVQGAEIDTRVSVDMIVSKKYKWFIDGNTASLFRNPTHRDAKTGGRSSDKGETSGETGPAGGTSTGPGPLRKLNKLEKTHPAYAADHACFVFLGYTRDVGDKGCVFKPMYRIEYLVFRHLSPRFARDYPDGEPRNIYMNTGLMESGVIQVWRVLCGTRDPCGFPTTGELMQAAVFFRNWEMDALEAYSLAAQRLYFIEMTSCPTDIFLTLTWQFTSHDPASPVRKILLSSIWRKLFYDDNVDIYTFSKTFFQQYQDDTFVDLRHGSWCSDFHALLLSLLRINYDNVFEAL